MTELNESLLGKYEAQGVEQHLIERLDMKNPTGATTTRDILENKINSMSPRHEFYDSGVKFGQNWVNEFTPNLK